MIISALMSIAVIAAGGPTPVDVCKKWGELAHTVMMHRQYVGVLSQALGMPEGALNAFVDSRVQLLIEAAYRQPREVSEEAKKESALDFSNKTVLACLEGLRK